MSRILLVLITVVVVISSYIGLGTCSMNILFNLFWDKVSYQTIKESKYEYGQFAGLPAGEDIPVLTNKELYEETEDYVTFRTDSIIPLDAYRLKDIKDTQEKGSLIIFSGRRPVRLPDKTIYHEVYTSKPGKFERNLYNRYYLVQIPDGAYVCAYLDDYYYYQYRWKGDVQLPIGKIWYSTSEEVELLGSYMKEYGIDEGRILQMFPEAKYKENKGLYSGVFVVLWLLVIGIYIFFIILVKKIIGRR